MKKSTSLIPLIPQEPLSQSRETMMKKGVFAVVLVLTVPFQVLAQNSAGKDFEQKVIKARPLNLSQVRLLGGPLKVAQDLDAKYLLELECDRMMAGYRLRAGLKAKAEGYGGWDSVTGKQLTGHIAGHYLSGVSLMWAATGEARF